MVAKIAPKRLYYTISPDGASSLILYGVWWSKTGRPDKLWSTAADNYRLFTSLKQVVLFELAHQTADIVLGPVHGAERIHDLIMAQ